MLWNEYANEEETVATEKIDGVNFVSPREDFPNHWMDSIRQINAEWVSIVPYAFSRGHVPEVTYDHDRQWWGERSEGTISLISKAQAAGLKTMIKPHVWVRGDGWPGDFDLETEEEWKAWESSYADYILANARIADSLNADMLCIGTEYRQAVKKRPAFWSQLIKDCREVYSGQLTYAANWDNYENVSFWGELDYIGVDAYFPVCDRQTPMMSTLKAGWQPVKSDLKSLSEKYQRPVIFTEYGYRSVDYAAAGHWELGQEDMTLNLEGQAVCYQALYEEFWTEPWFGGGFLWKWHPNPASSGGHVNLRYTPQNKPAMEVIRKWYGQ
jgi:hypothetical protein